ncbi:MAG TPA: DUF2917 domain-containing protein [Burkholderiales bacterium]|nr:DUF2917 domain-containing protein [Burkholderiales bacterium]
MRIELHSGGLRLHRGQPLKVHDGAGSTVCATEGSVWITEEGQPRDIVLEPGKCYRLREPGLAIVHPLGGEAAVTLS